MAGTQSIEKLITEVVENALKKTKSELVNSHAETTALRHEIQTNVSILFQVVILPTAHVFKQWVPKCNKLEKELESKEAELTSTKRELTTRNTEIAQLKAQIRTLEELLKLGRPES